MSGEEARKGCKDRIMQTLQVGIESSNFLFQNCSNIYKSCGYSRVDHLDFQIAILL